MSTNEIIHALEMGTARIAELNALLKEDRAELARLRAEVEQKSNLLVTAIKSAGDQATRAARAEVEKRQSVAAQMSAEREHNANEAGRLRAELVVEKNWVEHHSQHADDLIAENVKLRADLERFTGHGLLDCHASRAHRRWHPMPPKGQQMSTPTATPRTDAAEYTVKRPGTPMPDDVVAASFARTLETELAAERERVRVLTEAAEQMLVPHIENSKGWRPDGTYAMTFRYEKIAAALAATKEGA